MAGSRLVLWLFWILAAATAVAMLSFMATAEARPVRRVLAYSLAGDLDAPVIAWFALKAIATPGGRWRIAGRGAFWAVVTYGAVYGLLWAAGLTVDRPGP
ncbi:MAG: hypothetical protein ACYDBQ_07745 [Thermoplasmatota archaeon]